MGLQIKPVLPLSFFDPVTQVQRPSLSGQIELTGGVAFGMLVRHGITRTISLETGIDQIQRRYSVGILNDTSGYQGSTTLRWTGYEIPLTAMVFIRLGNRTYMNAAMGFALDMYPSDAVVEMDEGRAYFFRNTWVQAGVIGDLGVEYRTERSGIFYLGATYHGPFGPMATADLSYYDANFFPYTMRTELDGSYITVDLRYYFHEDPDKAKVKRTKK